MDCSDTANEIKNIEGETLSVKTDVSNPDEVKKMVDKTLDKYGRIDILVNNAGILKNGKAEDFSIKDWKNVLDINLAGQFYCAKEIGKQMIKQKNGKIINISSIAGLQGYAGSVPYSSSKGGVILLTKTLAAEWGQHNVNVNAVCPGVFATDMTEDYLKNEEFVENIKNNVPLARHADPEELVGTIIYLSSKASDYVTGHALVIDGGWTASL
ncbi:MAG: SDR family oxidoreductase [Candidatus Thermoplasmatota archaeon]